MTQIDTLLAEERRYPPPPEFAAQANVKTDVIPGLHPTVPASEGGDTAKSVTLPAKPDSAKAGAEKAGDMKPAPKLVPAPKATGAAPAATPATKPKG